MSKAEMQKRLFSEVYYDWVATYKEGAVKSVTLDKYLASGRWLERIAPKLKLKDLNRRTYQNILNEYAKTHEKQTTMDFHTQLKACIRDLFHDRLIDIDPTYRAVTKGAEPIRRKKSKFLQKEELMLLMRSLILKNEIDMNWFTLIAAKTGMRFAELLALTPADFDWANKTVTINKTWNYRRDIGFFQSTKTTCSERVIALDWQIIGQFKPLVENLPANEPFFIKKDKNGNYVRPYNSTYNYFLKKKCKEAGITIVSFHALRHTHASILLAEGVSIHTISKRLGHADISVTQETYAHVLNELQAKDDHKMMAALMQMS